MRIIATPVVLWRPWRVLVWSEAWIAEGERGKVYLFEHTPATAHVPGVFRPHCEQFCSVFSRSQPLPGSGSLVLFFEPCVQWSEIIEHRLRIKVVGTSHLFECLLPRL